MNVECDAGDMSSVIRCDTACFFAISTRDIHPIWAVGNSGKHTDEHITDRSIPADDKRVHDERSPHFNHWALSVTMTVCSDMNTAPSAGPRKMLIAEIFGRDSTK